MRKFSSGADFLSHALAILPILYGLNETHPSQKDDEQEVFYTTALTPERWPMAIFRALNRSVGRRRVRDVLLRRAGNGRTGIHPDLFTEHACLMLNLNRRKGQDIELLPGKVMRNRRRPHLICGWNS